MAVNYIRGANPIWYFVDLVGNQLNDSFYISYLSNVFPYVPQLVYQDNQGLIPWSDPIQFLANGTLPDNIYFPDNEVYRLEIRQGPTQADQLIYAINNYDPGEMGAVPPISNNGSGQETQISNGQFAFVNFPIQPAINVTFPSLSITTAGTYQIAPGWSLILTGAGTATITQLIFSGSQNILQADPNNPNSVPEYALRFNLSGWSSAILQQQFNGVGAIWYNNYVSASIFARSSNGVANPISVNYVPNTGGSGTPVPIISNVALTTGAIYETIQGIVPLFSSTNTTLNNAAFVDIQIVLPPGASTDISNIQVMGQNAVTALTNVTVLDETLERQKDHLFHYYADQLIIKPKNSILTGWNFPLNPFQFNSPTLTAQTVQCVYVADQTILYQQVANSVTTGRSSPVNERGFQVTPTGSAAATQFALIQYIDPSTIAPYWNFYLSSLVRAKLYSANSTKSSVRMKMRLIYRTTVPSTIGAAEPIASWTSGGDPVFSAGWTALIPQNDPAYVISPNFSVFESGNAEQAYSFNRFAMPPASTATMTLGIVLYTIDNFIVSSGDSIVFDKVSLCPNEFAVDTHPLTFDECLRQCQFYYEKSYALATLAGNAAAPGQQFAQQNIYFDTGTGNAKLTLKTFGFNFKQTKRAAPTLTFFSPSAGTANFLDAGIFFSTAFVSGPVLVNAFTLNSITTDTVLMTSTTSGAVIATGNSSQGQEGVLFYQYELDATLGS